MTAPRPLVLVTTGQRDRDAPLRRRDAVTGRNYADALRAVGLLPVLAPTAPAEDVDALLARVDGVVLSGGGDVDPAAYGQVPHPALGVVDPERDAFELALYAAARRRGVPLLGVCRGAQVMVVAEGGTLHQHLPAVPDVHGHEQAARDGTPHHGVTVDASSALAEAFDDDRVRVNSAHHQGIDAVGGELRPVAWSDDGLVEAVETTAGAFALGVQWHPEMAFAADARHVAPFRALARALDLCAAASRTSSAAPRA